MIAVGVELEEMDRMPKKAILCSEDGAEECRG